MTLPSKSNTCKFQYGRFTAEIHYLHIQLLANSYNPSTTTNQIKYFTLLGSRLIKTFFKQLVYNQIKCAEAAGEMAQKAECKVSNIFRKYFDIVVISIIIIIFVQCLLTVTPAESYLR